MLGNALYAQEHIFQRGPERWTHKWTHVTPGWHPVSFDSLCIFAVGALLTVADLGLFCGLVFAHVRHMKVCL